MFQGRCAPILNQFSTADLSWWCGHPSIWWLEDELLKMSQGGISKFITWSLFFKINRFFPHYHFIKDKLRNDNSSLNVLEVQTRRDISLNKKFADHTRGDKDCINRQHGQYGTQSKCELVPCSFHYRIFANNPRIFFPEFSEEKLGCAQYLKQGWYRSISKQMIPSRVKEWSANNVLSRLWLQDLVIARSRRKKSLG